MRVVVLVPAGGPPNPHRDRLWAFCRQWWLAQHPDWPIYEGSPPPGPYNRGAAINEAARQAGRFDVAIILDRDVIPNPTAVDHAIALAVDGHLALPYTERVMLTRGGTDAVLAGDRRSWRRPGFEERTYTGELSCCVIVNAATWHHVGGFDPLFVGWGFEDVAFSLACSSVTGPPMRVEAELFHLWHPTNPEDATALPPERRPAEYTANEARCSRYRKATPAAMRKLIAEAKAASTELATLDTRIPRLIFRTVPKVTTPDVEAWWEQFGALHPGWDLVTYREPLDPADWPITSPMWPRCANGAQKAGLLRLEALVRHGGIYVDSDVEPLAPLDALLHLPGFAGWEDAQCVPDFIMGAEAGHPAFVECLERALAAVRAGKDAWHSGPGVTTTVLPGRTDVLLLPPGAFQPQHYLDKSGTATVFGPWNIARHHNAGSWLSPTQRASIAARTR